MQLKIESNNKIYFNDPDFEPFKILLTGSFNYDMNSRIELTVQESFLYFNNLESFQNLCDEVKGKDKNSFLYLIMKNNFERSHNFTETIEVLNEFSFNNLKCIFLIFKWLQIPITNQEFEDIDIDKTLYDDFIVDWNNSPGPQNDVYLLKKEYINDKNIEAIKHLMELNLLSKISIYPYRNTTKESYFIPLQRPGMPKTFFSYINSNNQIDSSYNLWQKILKDRDNRLHKWSVSRF
ncbi:hypothetical protein [Sphingobacterium siyangense]|uniref:hypothetical protein n=1 Tax=Sphingobacterium siyangense TaxID=459529 RepID=UPI002FD9AC82